MMSKADQQDYLIDFQFIEQPKLINGIRLYQIGKKFCNQNTYIPPHLHIDWYELTVILGGKGKIYTNSKTEYIEVSEGDIYLSFPADIHAIESDSDSPLKYSFLSFVLNTTSFTAQFEKIAHHFYEPAKRIFRDRNISLLIELLLSEFMSVSYKQKNCQQNKKLIKDTDFAYFHEMPPCASIVTTIGILINLVHCTKSLG